MREKARGREEKKMRRGKAERVIGKRRRRRRNLISTPSAILTKVFNFLFSENIKLIILKFNNIERDKI